MMREHLHAQTLAQAATGFGDLIDITFSDGTTRQATPEEIRAATIADLHDQISAERDRREEAGFPYLDKRIDSDPRSVQRISIAATAAAAALQAGVPFAVEWTCADNSTMELHAAGVLGMPVALAQYAMALHMHGRALKAAVAAADDPLTIDITAGWPA